MFYSWVFSNCGINSNLYSLKRVSKNLFLSTGTRCHLTMVKHIFNGQSHEILSTNLHFEQGMEATIIVAASLVGAKLLKGSIGGWLRGQGPLFHFRNACSTCAASIKKAIKHLPSICQAVVDVLNNWAQVLFYPSFINMSFVLFFSFSQRLLAILICFI